MVERIGSYLGTSFPLFHAPGPGRGPVLVPRVQCRVVPCLISVIGIRGDPTRDNTAPCAALWDSEWTLVQGREINQAMRLLDVEKSVMPIETQFKNTIR